MSCNVDILNLRVEVLAAAFSAAPQLTLGATIDDLPVPYYLVSLTLSSSLLNFGTSELGVFVIIGQNERNISFSLSSQSPLYHVTLQNSLVGPPAVPIPTNKTTPKPFRQPILLPPRKPISLYTFGGTTAGNRLVAYLAAELVKKER